MVYGCMLLAACNIVGPGYYFLAGPEKAPARYEIEPTKSVVVFLDARGATMDRMQRRHAAMVAEKLLLEKEVVVKVISSETVDAVVAQERHGKLIGIVDVGTAVSADLVLYVKVDRFTLSTDGTTFSPTSFAKIKLMETATKERLWPKEDPGYYSLAVQQPVKQGDSPATGPARSAAERTLAERLGTAIAELFYEHEVRPIRERLGD